MKNPPHRLKNATEADPGDQQLAELARHAIESSRLRAWADQLRIDCHAGTVTLSGYLRSFYLKQILQTIILNLPSVQRVENHVEVRSIPAEADRGDHPRASSP